MGETHIIRVMAVDDHPLMMAGIVGEINAQPDMRVVAEASATTRMSVCALISPTIPAIING